LRAAADIRAEATSGGSSCGLPDLEIGKREKRHRHIRNQQQRGHGGTQHSGLAYGCEQRQHNDNSEQDQPDVSATPSRTHCDFPQSSSNQPRKSNDSSG
jgi:hypothetical protein